MQGVSEGKASVKAAASLDIIFTLIYSTKFQSLPNQVQLACSKSFNTNKQTPSMTPLVLPPSEFVSVKVSNRVYAPAFWNSSSFKTQMIILKMIPSKIIIALLALIVVIGAQSCPQLCTSNCSNGTCSSCRTDFNLDAAITNTCSCPSSMFLNSTSGVCLPCPITCSSCISSSNCTTCIPGFMISNQRTCIPGAQTANGWVSKNISLDFTATQPSGSNFLITVNNTQATQNVTAMGNSCSKMPTFTWLGGSYTFPYSAKVMKSIFSLPPHQWINIRFQAVLIDRWNGNTLLLEMNTYESYNQTAMELPKTIWNATYNSSQRFLDFCGNSSHPDNLAVVDVSIPHNASSIKLRIRLLESDYPFNATSNLNQLYYGVREIYVRVGTCGKNCRYCSGPGVCTECVLPYTLSNGICVCNSTYGFATATGCQANCLAGYYYNSTVKSCLSCENMVSNCQNCTSSSCSVCSIGYFLFSNSTLTLCRRYCPEGFTQTRNVSTVISNQTVYRDQCTACPSNCSTCTFSFCLFCMPGYAFYQGNCVQTCPQNTFLGEGSCQSCPLNCVSCTSNVTCTTCASGYGLVNSLCVPYCLNSTILSVGNSSAKVCNATCFTGCTNCFGPALDQCLACASGLVLQTGLCVSNCTGSFYSFNNSCLPCPSQCATCVNSFYCTSCNRGYFLNFIFCSRMCLSGYYPVVVTTNSTNSSMSTNSTQCASCPDGCLRCKNANFCHECDSRYFMFNFTCVQTKPVGFYFDFSFGKFKPCQSNCLQCNELVCFKCLAGYFLNQGVCVLNCGPDKFPYMKSFNNDSTQYGFCSWKSPQCLQYDNLTMNGTCNKCSFFQPNLFPVSGLGCKYSCPTFYVQTANGCVACPQNCRRCTSDMKCLECLYNYVINSIDVITTSNVMNQTCVPNYCAAPYFSDSVQCQKCPPGCQVCEIDGRCLTCQTGYLLSYDLAVCYASNCSSTQYYISTIASLCQACVSPCLSCISVTICTSCISLSAKFYLLNGQCLLSCPTAYFAHQNSGSCRKCHPKCETCTNFYNCLTCAPQFYLLSFYNEDQAQCVSECPVGFWTDTATCQRCYEDCQSCYGPSEYQCLSCYPNFYLDDYKCVWQCNINKYSDHEGYCDWCDPSCLQCNGPTVQNCLSCADNYYFYEHTCNIHECPDGTFLSYPEMRLCDSCQFGCSVCESPQFCRFCFPGYSLYRGWCYLQCPSGLVSRTYRFPYLNQIQGYICTTCLVGYSTNCVECDGSTCTRCNSGFFLYRNSLAVVNVTLKEQCVTFCPLGTYIKSNEERECVNCQTYCLNCTSYQNCVSCISGFNLINGYCTSNCPSGTYLTNHLNCSSCPSICTSCTSNVNCSSCISNYYIFLNSSSTYRTCIQVCPTGYFADANSGWCKKCLPTCTACTATATCTQCYSNFTLSNGLCINQTTNNCTANCQLCSGSNCLKCTPPYLLSNSDNSSTCVSTCPNGTFSNIFTCEACNASCLTCQYSANNCYQCQAGLYLLKQSCVNICPVGYFASAGLQTCQSCSANCLNCESTCYTCASGYYLYLGYCFATCPVKFYPSLSTGQCFSCPTGCNYCTNSSNCTTCNSTYTLYNGVCISICPQTTFSGLSPQGVTSCLPCPSPCYACTNISCISCLPGYILNGTICQSNCNSGFYISTFFTEYDDEDPSYNFSTYSQCSPCDSSCTTCVTSSTTCLSCNPPYILYGTRCISACPKGTYLNQTICSPCSAFCIACNDSVTCTACINSTVLYSNQCLTTCPAGFFMKLQTNSSLSPYICQACSPACQTCTGPSQYQCPTCSNQYYSNGNGSCLSTCPRGTYPNNLLQQCSSCPYSCSSCSSLSNCSSCISNFTLTSTNQCRAINTCNATNCQYCQTNSTSQCAQCLPNYYLVNATCVTQCPSNTYPSCNKCVNCSNGCVSCNSQGCISCSNTTVLYQGTCVSACPAGTYNVSNKCQSNPCLAYSSVNNDCLSCAAPYLLSNVSTTSSNVTTYRMTCVLTCQAGFVKAGSNCVPCPSSCTSCISTSICTSCAASAMLYQGSCLYTCPVGTYAFNSVCQKCTLPYCTQCTLLGGVQVCTDCEDSSGTFLANGTCVITCPAGTYATTGSLNCNNCSNNCYQCTGLNSCTACASGFYLYLGQCLTSCPTGTSLSGNSCVVCSTGCSQCSSITNCSLCQSSYSLSFSSNGSSCVTVCQPGFYSKSIISTSYTNNYQYQCAACVAPCLTCTSATACTQCVGNTSLYLTSCVQSCPQGTYSTISQTVIVNSVSYSTSVCNPCSTSCLTCANTASYCMSCPSGYLLDSNNNCVSNCNSATSYYSSTTRQCYSCSQQCYSCYGPGSDNCLSCRPVLQLFAGSCFSTCPFGYYATSAYICQSCSSSCVTCLGASTNCTLCNTNLYLQVVNYTGTCVSSCNVGLYINYTSLTCMVCDSTCAACVGISTQCINCPVGLFLYNYRCYATCPSGTTATFTNSIYRCSACPSNCVNCTFNTTSSRLTCTVCSSGYYLVSGNCSQTCPTGTYSSPSTFTCVTCQIFGCQTCSLNSSLIVSCSACQAGYFIFNGACYSSCPSGTVASGVQCVVQPTCQGYLFLGFCFNICPVGTYATNISVTTSGVVTFTLGCNNCSSFCSNCLSASLCIQCISTANLYTTNINGTLQSTCVNACPNGFYSAVGVCLACASPCMTCQQTTTGVSCLTCLAGFYLLGSSCYTTCPSGYFASGSICIQCSSICSACSGSPTNCTICKNNLALAPNCSSSANCTSGQYLSGNATCSACNSACLTCYGGSSYECSSCANSSNVLVNGICTASCALGTMQYQSTCVSCPNNCLTCSMNNNTFSCTSCASPYILASIVGCVLSCSDLNTATTSYLLVNGSCQLCNISGCLTCITTSNSSLQCTTCNNASFLYNQACYSICPTGTMATYNPNTCVSCPQNCTNCSSTYCFKCATGLVLLDGVCVTSCGSGYYNMNGTCIQCSVSNCISCSATGCLSCQQPYLLANATCSGCISGYYYSYGTCYICSSPCLTCSGYSSSCTSCVTSYILINNTCVQSCPTGFYVSSSTCVACTVSNCQTCTSTGCSSCMTGYYSYYQSNQTTCVSACPSGTYAVSTFPTCTTCSALCTTCTSSSSCLTCQSPAVLYQGYCLSSCPSGSTNVNQTCASCLSGCKTCTSLTNCTSCNTGLVANANGTCTAPISNCSTGYYLNALKNCSQCFSTCKTCSGGASFDCLSCFTGYLLVNGVCTQSCNSDSYYSNSTSSCQLCSNLIANCVSCTSTSCLSCATNYTVSNGSCTRSCPSSTYLSNGVCNSCPNYCLTCSSSTSCSQCLNATFILMNGLCYSSCPDQTFLSNNTCASCYQTCLTCSGSVTNCSSCITPYSLYGSSCYSACPNGTYSSNYTCQNCSSNCALCSDANTCTLCSGSYYLMNGTCRSNCLSGYYIDTASNRCIQCPSPCLVCSSRTNCTSCQSPSTLNSGMCVNSNCSSGYYNYTVNICVNCTINHCGYCTNSSCSYCASGYYSIYQNGVLTYCEPGCLSGTYPDNATMNCTSCFTNCFSCISTTWCSICKSGFYLLAVQGASANQCVTSCPPGYYINNSTLSCSSCSNNCETCMNSNVCTDCANNYYLFVTSSSTTCVSNCPTGYFNPTVLDGSGSCGQCVSNCYTCSDVQTCTQCISSSDVIINGVCTPSNCVHCLVCSSSANACNTCIAGYYSFNSGCLASCPDNYYADNSTQSCQSCTTNCLLCTQSTDCLLCISGYVFVNGTGCQNAGLIKFGVLGNMSGFTSNITKIMSIVYVSTSAGPIAFGAIGSTYGPMQFCQFMYLLQGSTGGNEEVTNFLNSMSSVSYTTNSGTGNTANNQLTGNSTASTARRLTAISYTSSFLETNYPVFLIMLAFICSYFVVLLLEKYNQSCCLSCPTLLKYISYTCDFMKKRFKYIYVDCVMWISYLPFLYFAILQLQIGKFDTGINIFSSLLAIVIIIVYPLYPVFILRKLFDRNDNPMENLANYKAITLKEPKKEEKDKALCEDFTCCQKEKTNIAMMEMSLSPYIEKVVRPIYNEHDRSYNEFRYFTIPHFRLAYAAIKYFRKFIYVMIVALCPNPVTTLSLLLVVTLLYIVYLIALKPKEKLYLVLEIILECVLLFFVTFMLIYVSVGGANVSYLSIVTHAIGFIIANSTLAIAIILNIMSYYTIFCCIVDLIKHIRNKKIEDENPVIPDEKQFQIENIHDPDDVDGTGEFTLEKELKGKFNDKQDLELRKSNKRGDDEMTVENNDQEQYVPYDLDEKEFNVRSSMINKKKKAFEDDLPEEDFDNLKSTKNPKAKRDRRAERKKSSHHLEDASHTSEEIMGQSKLSTEQINDGLLKDKNSKYKREVNKNDVNVNRGELREPTNNFRRNKNSKDVNPNEQESIDTLMRPEGGKKRSNFSQPFDEFALEIDTHERMVPGKLEGDFDPKFAERQAKRRQKKDDYLNPMDEPYMRERQGKSKNSKPNDLDEGNMYDRQGKLRENRSGKEPQSGNMYERDNKKRINNNFNDFGLEEVTGKERIKKAKEEQSNPNSNDMFEVIGKDRNKDRVGEGNMYDRQGRPKNQKDANKERDLENANMVEKKKNRQDNLFGEFEEIFDEVKPGVKDANMKERQRQNKEKSLNEQNLLSGFLVEPNTVERKPQAKKLENLHYKGSSEEEGVVKEGQVVEAQNKFKRNIRQKPSDNIPEGDINAYGKDIKTRKAEKVISTKEFAEDTPEEARYKERQAKEINKAKSYNERAQSQDVEEVSAYNREKKVMEKKKKETQQKIEDANLLSVNPKIQQKQKSKKQNIYDDLDNELAESVEFKIQGPKQKRPNAPEDDFEQSEMGKNIKAKEAKRNKRRDHKLQVSENIEESYDDVVKRNKEIMFKQKQGGQSKLLEIEDDFEEENYSRPASKISRPSSRSKDGGLGINSRAEEGSDNESSVRKQRASAIQRQRSKGSMKVNENELNVDESQVAADQRKKSKIYAPKSNRIRGVLNIDDKSDDDNLEQLKF